MNEMLYPARSVMSQVARFHQYHHLSLPFRKMTYLEKLVQNLCHEKLLTKPVDASSHFARTAAFGSRDLAAFSAMSKRVSRSSCIAICSHKCYQAVADLVDG